jgi:hypothetical protein
VETLRKLGWVIVYVYRMFSGTPWVFAPGRVQLKDADGVWRVFDFTHWRLRSLFRGRSFKLDRRPERP